jgi:hypothetical protein
VLPATSARSWLRAQRRWLHLAVRRQRHGGCDAHVQSPGFDTFKDFTMVGRVGRSDLLLIAPLDSGLRRLSDLIDRRAASGQPELCVGRRGFARAHVG